MQFEYGKIIKNIFDERGKIRFVNPCTVRAYDYITMNYEDYTNVCSVSMTDRDYIIVADRGQTEIVIPILNRSIVIQ